MGYLDRHPGARGGNLAAVRSAGRSTGIAERALLAGMRPVLASSRHTDSAEPVQFADGRVFEVGSGRPLVQQADGVIYLSLPLRNVGAGIAQLRGYHLEPESAERVLRDPQGPARHRRGDTPPDPSAFAEQQRDLYVPAGDPGFWQAALRDPVSELYASMSERDPVGWADHDRSALRRPRGWAADDHAVRAAARPRSQVAM
jgi:hypothetical protein